MRLAIELYGTVIGTLEGSDSRAFDFIATEDGIEKFGVNSPVLSVVVPLSDPLPRHHARRRRNWFNELLPEGDQLEFMLAQSGIRRGDTLRFLARYGRDVAGALQVWDTEDPTEPRTPSTSPTSIERVRELLESPMATPLANEPSHGKSSLPGVQPKIVLVRSKEGWAQALGGYPTTHILKPRLESKPTLIFDEEYGSRLARRLGLANFDTTIEDFNGLPAIVIERFDRKAGSRVHQEDFSQALGASGSQKYQEFGGVVSLRRIADTLDRSAGAHDRKTLGRLVVFAVAIGNLDMHSKNIGLLHPDSGDVRLAPAYDVVPLVHQPGGDGRMALAVNKRYRHDQITRDDLVSELTGWGLVEARKLIDDVLSELLVAIDSEDPLEGSSPIVQADIRRFVRNLIERRSAGAPSLINQRTIALASAVKSVEIVLDLGHRHAIMNR